ncbi:MAG TPA: hypothetical protein VK527_07735 [Candidatus Limnocylindrales bacterium]|jgi:hypothetical protein|nr:hypothetical protein [Candidatus Limnocylindrales bacterium]
MIPATTWQDLIAVFAALLAGGWLFRRWMIKRRTRSGCDTCAAAAHVAHAARRPAGAQNSKAPTP